MLLAFTARGGMPAEYREYQVKAVWMLNFIRFVDWPENAFASKDSPCIIGVLGKDPFGEELVMALAKKEIRGRRFLLRRIQRENDATGCHVLFIPASEHRAWREMQPRMAAQPILVIGETDGFLEQGGIINFMIQDASISFEIDLHGAQKAGLKFDANLLKIAARVKGRYE